MPIFLSPRFGYDKQGYNKQGYDKQGYNRFGKKNLASNDVSIAAGIQRVQARIAQKPPRRPSQEEFHFISFKDSQVTVSHNNSSGFGSVSAYL